MHTPWSDPQRFPGRMAQLTAAQALCAQGDSLALHEARLSGVMAGLKRLLSLPDADIRLFASENDALCTTVLSLLLPTDALVVCAPIRPALGRLLGRSSCAFVNVPRDPQGHSQPDDWRAALASAPNALVVVAWEPDAGGDLAHALLAGVRPERLVVLAGAGFAGQLPWALPVQPLLAIAALRDPDLPDPPLAWLAVSTHRDPALHLLSGDAELTAPALAATESLLHTLGGWPEWTAHAQALLAARADALAGLVQAAPQLVLWLQQGAEAYVRCPTEDGLPWLEAWRAAGWVVRQVPQSQWGPLLVVDLFASRPPLAASKEWPPWP